MRLIKVSMVLVSLLFVGACSSDRGETGAVIEDQASPTTAEEPTSAAQVTDVPRTKATERTADESASESESSVELEDEGVPTTMGRRILTNAVLGTSLGNLEHGSQPLPIDVGCAELSAPADALRDIYRGRAFNFLGDFVPQVGIGVFLFNGPEDAEAWVSGVPVCDGLQVVDEVSSGDFGLVQVQRLGLAGGEPPRRAVLVAGSFVVQVDTLGTDRERAEAATEEMVINLTEQLERAVVDNDLPFANPQAVIDDRSLLAARIATIPLLLGEQFAPRIGLPSDDSLLERVSFVNVDGCGSRPGGHTAALNHFTGIATPAGVGSVQLWVVALPGPVSAVTYNEDMRTFWNECVDEFNASSGLVVPPIRLDDDLLGDGSGIEGGQVSFVAFGGGTNRQFDLVSDRLWGRILLSGPAGTDSEIDASTLVDALVAFEALLNIGG